MMKRVPMPSDIGRIEEAKCIRRFIESLQEEPVSERFAFKAIPRLLEMIEPTDRAKAYITKLADTLEVEGYLTDAKIVRERIKIMNGEKVPMATMDGEPVSEDLEEAAKDYSNNLDNIYGSMGEQTRNAFKAGAKWKEQQMMSKAVNGVEINSRRSDGRCILSGNFSRFDTGDKVKLIIIKQE
jgi:hypothetical protein